MTGAWATPEMQQARAGTRRRVTEDRLRDAVAALLRQHPDAETFTWAQLSEQSGVAKSTISRHVRDETRPFQVSAEVARLRSLILRQTTPGRWHEVDFDPRVADPRLLAAVGQALLLRSGSDDQPLPAMLVSQAVALMEKALELTTLYADPEVLQSNLELVQRWLEQVHDARTALGAATGVGVAARMGGYEAFAAGASGERRAPAVDTAAARWAPLCGRHEDVWFLDHVRLHYLLGIASVGRHDLLAVQGELIEQLPGPDRAVLVAGVLAASWLPASSRPMQRGCERLARRIALDLDPVRLRGGSADSLTAFWRAWAVGDPADIVHHGLTHLGIDRREAPTVPTSGSEEICPLVHEALLQLGRASEAAVLVHVAQSWVDSRRTDFLPAGLRYRYARMLAQGGQDEDARRDDVALEALLRQGVLELRLARALGVGLPDELRDLAADLLRMIATAR